MVDSNAVTLIQKGMHVHASDGTDLGKVSQVWYGTDPSDSTARCDEDICSRVEVHHGWFGREVLYIPISAIADISGQVVALNVDAAEVREREGWHRKPSWLPVEQEDVGPHRF
jgi:hypothetical protein